MITSIQITNLGGFASFLIPAMGSVITVTGKNGSGKSSLLDAIKYLAQNGHDPSLLKAGTDAGEIVATFSDGTQCRAKVTKEGTERSWRPKDGKRWTRGREFIDKVCAAIDYDPIAFLDLKPKQQAEKLLEICDVQATHEEILEAVADAQDEANTAPLKAGMSGLEVLNTLHATIYAARRTLNAGADQLESHAAELANSIGPAAPEGTDWAGAARAAAEQKQALEAEERKEIQHISDVFGMDKAGRAEARKGAEQVIDADINNKIAALERERSDRKAGCASLEQEAVEAARATATEQAAAVRARLRPEIERLAGEHTVAQERAMAHERAAGTQKAADAAKASATAKKAKSATLTAALERISALKLKLAERLPIPGVTVSGGQIVREEDSGLVPFARWNTASKLQLCLKVAMLHGGSAGFVVIDKCESFEQKNLEALYAAAKRYASEQGCQFIISVVDPQGGDLRVGTV